MPSNPSKATSSMIDSIKLNEVIFNIDNTGRSIKPKTKTCLQLTDVERDVGDGIELRSHEALQNFISYRF